MWPNPQETLCIFYLVIDRGAFVCQASLMDLFQTFHHSCFRRIWIHIGNIKKHFSLLCTSYTFLKSFRIRKFSSFHLSLFTGCKLNRKKTFRRRPIRLLYIFYTLDLRPISRKNEWKILKKLSFLCRDKHTAVTFCHT